MWIWSAEGVARPRPDAGPFRVRYFRRRFEAPAGAALVVHVSADSRYKLWCNGTLVSRGPAKGDIQHQFYDTIDLAGLLRAGRNVLAAQVEYYGDIWCDYGRGGAPVSQMTACPVFVLDGVLLGSGDTVLEELHSDERWRVLVDTAHRHQIDEVPSVCVGMTEDLNAAAYPWGFAEPDFDDSAWPLATAITRAFRLDADIDSLLPHRLVPRMIAPLEVLPPKTFTTAFGSPMGADLPAWNRLLAGKAAITVPPHTQVTVLIDAGEYTTAYPRLSVAGGAGAQVRLTYAEALSDEHGRKGRRDDLTAGQIRGYGDIYRPDGHERTYEPFFWRSFRFVRIDIQTAGEPLTLRGLEYAFTGYPFAALAEATSSDESMAGIWEMCWRTARSCAHETYEDCPYYEQMQYGGDTQVQAMVSYTIAGDAALARQFLYQFDWSRRYDGLTRSRYPSRVPQIIPYWSLHWVMALREYWQYTGDAATVRDLLPGVGTVMHFFERRRQDDGTIGRFDGWGVADWCPQWMGHADGNGVPPGTLSGQGSFTSLMVAAALGDAAELARAAGEKPAEFLGRARTLRAAAHTKWFDAARGLYTDLPAGSGLDTASAYTNVWAILAGMPCDLPALAERIIRDRGLCELTMYSMYWAWQALDLAGRMDLWPETMEIWRQMRQWGFSTCPETPDFVATRSDCHAWGAGPLVTYCRHLLGVTPAEPGYAVIGIAPQRLGQRFARGRVPVFAPGQMRAEGLVEVDWRIDATRFILKANVPSGRPAKVTMPDGGVHNLPFGGHFELDCPAGPA